MDVKHSSFKKISVQACHENDPRQETSTIEMMLFNDKYKLRSHAIKHFTNTLEFEKVWKNYMLKNNDSLAIYITNLESIDCPFLRFSYSSPPCQKCQIFDTCSSYISGIEQSYLKGIEDILINECNLPRYSMFFSKRDKKKTFSGLSDTKVTLKASIIEKDIFNLMTCYVKLGKPLNEIMNLEVAKILSEADSESIKWCNKSEWGIKIGVKNNKMEKKKSNKTKPLGPPYKRGGGTNWKQYLNNMEDW
ncbi:MAG: hypothetical protein K9L30_18540 [Desulfobacterales bacterium]|nr:hypothetical protein [Desulfobacterales bacterium]